MQAFKIGRSLGGNRGPIGWNPDAPNVGNGHLIITGESGSGKSHMVRRVVQWLAQENEERQGKHIYVLDLHGDMHIEDVDENVIEFTGRNSPHGINPFEFDMDERNGGCGVQNDMIVAMIKKAFLPKMGSRQEALLRQLVNDCYRVKGIDDDDPATWERELPSMETLLTLIRQILDYQKNSGGRIAALIQKMDALRRSIEKTDSAGYFRKAIQEAGIGRFEQDVQEIITRRDERIADRKKEMAQHERQVKSIKKRRERKGEYQRQLDTLLKGFDPASLGDDATKEEKAKAKEVAALQKKVEAAEKESDEAEIEQHTAEIIKLRERIAAEPSDDAVYDEHIAEILEEATELSAPIHGETTAKSIVSKLNSLEKTRKEIDFLMRRYTSYCKSGAFAPMFGNELPEEIDPGAYSSSSSIASLESLELYISVAAQSGIFSAKKPPVKPGLNRLDISGLTPELQSFFVDTFVNRIFLTMKRRGEYKPGPRGRKLDTYIVIDEGAAILPSGRELNSNKFILNKSMKELRKFGCGLLFISQSPSDFSSPLLSAYTKFVFKLAPDVVPAARKTLGISDGRLFDVIKTPRTALVELGRGFESVAVVGYEERGDEPKRGGLDQKAIHRERLKQRFSGSAGAPAP